MQSKKVLFVLTSHDRLGPAGDETAEPTGFHLAEAARPWKILRAAGHSIDLATPDGKAAPVDPSSLDLDDEDNAAFMNDGDIKRQLETPKTLGTVDLDDYDALYFPGGHGTMWDLPGNDAVQAAVRKMYEDGKIVAAVCHGPAALVNVKLSNGRWLVDGKTLSVFTDDEERAVEKDTVVPFLLGSKLRERGALLDEAPNFSERVSTDERLITGQNPASAKKLGELLKTALRKKHAGAPA